MIDDPSDFATVATHVRFSGAAVLGYMRSELCLFIFGNNKAAMLRLIYPARRARSMVSKYYFHESMVALQFEEFGCVTSRSVNIRALAAYSGRAKVAG